MKILIFVSILALAACAKKDSAPADSARVADSIKADSGAGRDTLADTFKVHR